MLKYLSLFSGIGGFEQGIKQSGVDMECIGFSEVDSYAKSIYLKWFSEHKDWGDATEIKTEELPKFDFLVGGFPCQAFSIAGKRQGFDDTRGTLFFEIARILKDKRPRYFLFENVSGLLSHDGGRTFKAMLGILSELGYYVEWEILNSKNFGIPQNRARVFLKGYFGEECGREIFSQKRGCRETDGRIKWQPTTTRTAKFVDKDNLALTLCSDGHNCGYNQLIKCNGDKSLAQRVYDEEGIATSLKGCGGGQGGKTGLYKVNKIKIVGNTSKTNYYAESVLDPEGISNTINANNYKYPLRIRTNVKKGYDEADKFDGVRLCHPTSTTNRGRVHKEEVGTISAQNDWGTVDKDYRIRRLTPKECERLQGFPDGWTEYGKDGELISDTQRYKCLGNAVTVNVIEYLIWSMFGDGD